MSKFTFNGLHLVYLGKRTAKDDTTYHGVAALVVPADDPRNLLASRSGSLMQLNREYINAYCQFMNTATGSDIVDMMRVSALPLTVEQETYPGVVVTNPTYIVFEAADSGGPMRTGITGTRPVADLGDGSAYWMLDQPEDALGEDKTRAVLVRTWGILVEEMNRDDHYFYFSPKRIVDADGSSMGYIRIDSGCSHTVRYRASHLVEGRCTLTQVSDTGTPFRGISEKTNYELCGSNSLDFWITVCTDSNQHATNRVTIHDADLSNWLRTTAHPSDPDDNPTIAGILVAMDTIIADYTRRAVGPWNGSGPQSLTVEHIVRYMLDVIDSLSMNGVTNAALGEPRNHLWVMHSDLLVYGPAVEEAARYLEDTHGVKRDLYRHWKPYGYKEYQPLLTGLTPRQIAHALISDRRQQFFRPFVHLNNADMFC